MSESDIKPLERTVIAIPLRGKTALYAYVDEADLPLVRGYKWHAKTTIIGSKAYAIYAVACVREGESSHRRVRHIRMHRLIMGIGADDPHLVDHRDGDGLNNRRSNLRICSVAQNSQNTRRAKSRTSRFKGVSWHATKKQFRARIKVEGREVLVGWFDDQLQAALAYDRAAAAAFGEFAATNAELGLLNPEAADAA